MTAARRPALSASNATSTPVVDRSGRVVEGVGLAGGEDGAAGRDAGVAAGAGGGDGDGVEGAFDEDRPRSSGERAAGFPEAEQDLAFVVQAGGRAVEVLRHVGAGVIGEARPMNAMMVPSAERMGSMARSRKVSVRAPRRGPAGQPGGLDERVRVAGGAQVAGQPVPGGVGVAGLPALLDRLRESAGWPGSRGPSCRAAGRGRTRAACFVDADQVALPP